MKIISCIWVVLCCISCSNSVVGTYTMPYKMIIINEDSSYLYEYRMVDLLESSEGTWRILDKRNLFFESFRYQNLPLVIDSSMISGSFKAILADHDTLISYFNIFLVTDSMKEELDLKNGYGILPYMEYPEKLMFKIVPNERISRRFKQLELYSDEIELKSHPNFGLILKFDWWMFYSKEFKADTLNLKCNRIKWEGVSVDKFKKMPD